MNDTVYGCLTVGCSERLKGMCDEPAHCSVCLQDLSPLSAHDEDLVSYSAKVRELEAEVERLREQRDAAREALQALAEGTWNNGASEDKTFRQFARAALASTVPSEEQSRVAELEATVERLAVELAQRTGERDAARMIASGEQPGGGG